MTYCILAVIYNGNIALIDIAIIILNPIYCAVQPNIVYNRDAQTFYKFHFSEYQNLNNHLNNHFKAIVKKDFYISVNLQTNKNEHILALYDSTLSTDTFLHISLNPTKKQKLERTLSFCWFSQCEYAYGVMVQVSSKAPQFKRAKDLAAFFFFFFFYTLNPRSTHFM